MELVDRQRFTNMLRILVDVTTEKLVYGKKTNPCIFDGYITEYRNRDDRLLAQVLHTNSGPVYYIDFEWEQNHNTDFTCPPHKSNIELGMDDRGWIFVAIRNTNDYPESDCIRILAGCRNFSLEQAKEHWKDNPEVYPRILMAEQIAIHRGWIPKQNDILKIEEILKNVPDSELLDYARKLGIDAEPQVDAGELTCEKTPTIVAEGDIRELELRVHDSLLK
jgi:hypothetical protein